MGKKMRILVACEFSGAVRDEFLKKGHDVISCDLQEGKTAGPHYQGDVRDLLNYPFDMVISFPPCTHLACSGAKHFAKKKMDGRQYTAVSFFMLFANLNVSKVCIENPVGIMSELWRKPDQIIQPYYFGDSYQKTTCLWLKGLNPLQHKSEPDLFGSDITHVDPGEFVETPSGKRLPKWYSDNTDPNNRSKTFPGIAKAMADQWG